MARSHGSCQRYRSRFDGVWSYTANIRVRFIFECNGGNVITCPCNLNLGLIMCFFLASETLQTGRQIRHVSTKYFSACCMLIDWPISKIAIYSRDFSSLLSELGNRGSALLASSENGRNESNGTLTEELENATNIYAKLQKVICGRDLSSEEASGSLLGGSTTQ